MNPESMQHAICASVDAHAQAYTAASDAIWEHP